MPKSTAPNTSNLEQLDRFYREGGLLTMASPHVHEPSERPGWERMDRGVVRPSQADSE